MSKPCTPTDSIGSNKVSEQVSVWGPEPWDPLECKRYIVEVIGNSEQFPALNPYHPGATTILDRLINRYGDDYSKSCAKLLRNFLEDLEDGSPEEQKLWRDWRLAQADRVVGVDP